MCCPPRACSQHTTHGNQVSQCRRLDCELDELIECPSGCWRGAKGRSWSGISLAEGLLERQTYPSLCSGHKRVPTIAGRDATPTPLSPGPNSISRLSASAPSSLVITDELDFKLSSDDPVELELLQPSPLCRSAVARPIPLLLPASESTASAV